MLIYQVTDTITEFGRYSENLRFLGKYVRRKGAKVCYFDKKSGKEKFISLNKTRIFRDVEDADNFNPAKLPINRRK